MTRYICVKYSPAEDFYLLVFLSLVLLQHGADPNIKNTDGKTACDLADPGAKLVLTGDKIWFLFKFVLCAILYFCLQCLTQICYQKLTI